MANSYTGMESLPLEVVNTIYWMSEYLGYSTDDGVVLFVKNRTLQEMRRRFGNDERLAAEWMEQNRPYWSYPGGK